MRKKCDTDNFPFTLRKIGEDKYQTSQELLNDLLELGFEFTPEEEHLFSKLRCELSEEEEQIIKRFEAVIWAMKSLMMSGFIFTEESIEDHKRIALGEITFEEYEQEILRCVERLKITNPEYFTSNALKN